MKFYACKECNKIQIRLEEMSNESSCCGDKFVPLIPNLEIEEIELHKPLIRKIGNFVTVSINEEHPNKDVHRIEFVVLETNEGFHYKKMKQEGKQSVRFILDNFEEIVQVYTYCNVHKLYTLK